MKKIILILFVLVSSITFGQSITWSNAVPQVEQGQTISLELTYADLADPTPIQIETGPFPGSGAFGVTTASLTGGSGTFTMDYTIAADTPLTADIAPANIFLRIFETISFATNANTPIEVLPPNTLSVNDFNKNDLKSSMFHNHATDIISFGDNVVTETYQVFNIAGIKVLETEATGSLNVATLASGLYVMVTDSGISKFVR